MDQLQLFGLLDTATKNLALAALIVSSGLLTIVATREAFEHDPPEAVEQPMGVAPLVVRRWKYLSEHAERARRDLYVLAEAMRVGIGSFLLFLMVCVVAAAASSFAQWWGAGSGAFAAELRGLHAIWTDNVNQQAVAHYLFAAVVILFGPMLVYKLSIVVYRVVMLRRAYGGAV
jgi:hypothetical protein